VHAHVQRLVSVVKITTVPEEYATAEQRSVLHFLWKRGLNAKVIYKKMFPIYVEKCLSCKVVQPWWQTFRS
jgi:hypothetical protein